MSDMHQHLLNNARDEIENLYVRVDRAHLAILSILDNLPRTELCALALCGKLTDDAAEHVTFALMDNDEETS